MKNLLCLLAIGILFISCTAKPVVYEIASPPAGFRMHDKDQKTTLVALDSFLVEDSEDDNDTKYTTTANIKTYMDTYYQPLEATLTDIADGTIAENLVNTAYPWSDNETANTLTVTAQSGSTWNLADSISLLSVYSGTTSLEEYVSAIDSGAYIIGVYDEFENSTNHNIQAVLNDFDTALDARCLESVFGTAIGTGLLLDTATLKVSAILQKYHGVDPSTDVLTMLGSDNSTVILSNIGAEPALTDEDSLYSTLSDVSQFYEPGDNVTTAHGTTLPTTCSVGQTFAKTDEDTDGALCTCMAENTWKCLPNALSGDKIEEDDSSVEVVDDNITEQVVVTVSGTQIGLFDANGLDITGTINADGYEMSASADPRIRFLDANCTGTDKFIGSIDFQYVDGADGAENGDIYIRSQEGGANTTQIQYDESDTSWEIPTGKNLVLDGGYVVGAARIGTEISANATLATSQQRAIVYKASAACTVTLDAAADVGYGYIVGFKVKDASETLILRPEGGEIVNLHGTALAAGTGIQSPGNAGDFIFLMAVTDASGTTDGYETWGYGEEPWTSE